MVKPLVDNPFDDYNKYVLSFNNDTYSIRKSYR